MMFYITRPNCAFCALQTDSATDQNQICRGIRNNATFLWSSLLFWILQTNTWNIVPLKIAPKIGEYADSANLFVESITVCGTHKQIIRDFSIVTMSCYGIRNYKLHPQIVSGIRISLANSFYICGFHLHFAESTYSCRIQNN